MFLGLKLDKKNVKKFKRLWISWKENVWWCKENEIKIIKEIIINVGNNVIKESKSKTIRYWKSQLNIKTNIKNKIIII
jgi:hypothetical protein